MASSMSEILTEVFGNLEIDEVRSRGDVIKETLIPNLRENRLTIIASDNPCFEPARRLCRKYNIEHTSYRFTNFVRLLKGYLEFPFILLQNPSNRHEKPFAEMKKCPTIDLIATCLDESGLHLDEVPIIDICSMFSDSDLRRMDDQRRAIVTEDSYKMVEDTLNILRPRFIVVCQCVTKYGSIKSDLWTPAENALARKLCSSFGEAKAGSAVRVCQGKLDTWAIKGLHPMRAVHQLQNDQDTEYQVLRALFEDVYSPCLHEKRNKMSDDSICMETAVRKAIRALQQRTQTYEDHIESVAETLLSDLCIIEQNLALLIQGSN